MQKFFFGGGLMVVRRSAIKTDEALTKRQLEICIEYTYISELMLWLHWGKFVNLKCLKLRALAALKIAK